MYLDHTADLLVIPSQFPLSDEAAIVLKQIGGLGYRRAPLRRGTSVGVLKPEGDGNGLDGTRGACDLTDQRTMAQDSQGMSMSHAGSDRRNKSTCR